MVETAARTQASPRLQAFARRSALIGVVVWLLLLPAVTADARETELIHKVVFFAMLVIVPLGLSLVLTGDQRGGLSLYRVVLMVQPVAAILAVASFFFEKGVLSAAFSSAWFVFTSIVALFGLIRLVSRRFYPVEEVSVDAGLLYLPVAAVWLMIYRYGVQPFDYGETIILLTVVHFHFAGFAAPIIAGLVGRRLANERRSVAIFPLIIFAIVGAMPLVAAGITFSLWLGLLGALLLTCGLALLAVITILRILPGIDSFPARALLATGAVSSCVAMVLACLYAYSLVAHVVILRIPTMAMTHGLLNAFGFATCSLLGWTAVAGKDPRA